MVVRGLLASVAPAGRAVRVEWAALVLSAEPASRVGQAGPAAQVGLPLQVELPGSVVLVVLVEPVVSVVPAQ